jgi:hypothetical protein
MACTVVSRRVRPPAASSPHILTVCRGRPLSSAGSRHNAVTRNGTPLENTADNFASIDTATTT